MLSTDEVMSGVKHQNLSDIGSLFSSTQRTFVDSQTNSKLVYLSRIRYKKLVPSGQANALLSRMELKGLIKESAGEIHLL